MRVSNKKFRKCYLSAIGSSFARYGTGFARIGNGFATGGNTVARNLSAIFIEHKQKKEREISHSLY